MCHQALGLIRLAKIVKNAEITGCSANSFLLDIQKKNYFCSIKYSTSVPFRWIFYFCQYLKKI